MLLFWVCCALGTLNPVLAQITYSQYDTRDDITQTTFVNNGYEDLYIGISDQLAEDPNLIQEIKDWVTDGSASLYRATRSVCVCVGEMCVCKLK